MTDPIEEGVKLVPELQRALGTHGNPTAIISAAAIETIIAALTAAGEMARELAEAREALKPFRDLMERIECTSLHDYSDETKWDLDGEVTVGDLRRAARALETPKPRI